MAKRGPINKVEAFYIINNYKTLPIAELAVDLDRGISSIEKYIKQHIVNTNKTSETVSTIKAGDQFARHKGSVVMTENASTLGDAKRKKPMNKIDCVTKVKEDV